MERCFQIIGAGVGTAELLTEQARIAIARADAVLTTARLAALRTDAEVCSIGMLAKRALALPNAKIALLVSGDVGFFSAAKSLRQALLPYGEVQLLCGISSMQYFCAKCGVSYEDACIRSLHGRQGSLLGAVSYHTKVFALTGGEHTADAICRTLTQAGLGHLTVHLGENLGDEKERIETGTAAELAQKNCSDLAVLLIENPNAVSAAQPVQDSMLTRGDVPMTKEEVRWISVNKLQIQPNHMVWDIGAGTGSVTIELARKACDGMVYAIERKEDAVALLQENRKKLGAFNVKVVAGKAPEVLSELPVPDAVFIGGSGGQMHTILKILKEKNPQIRVVVNVIALETLSETIEAMHALHFSNIETIQIAAARGKSVGKYTMMTANNPVFILSGGGYES